jgi:Flp pilus assembly protein TadB
VPALLVCLAFLVLAPAARSHSVTRLASSPVTHPQFARLGGGFGRGGFGARNRGFGRRGFRSHRGRSIFRSILRALAIGYLLHLLFTTPGGLLVLVLMILGVVLLMSRLRRRRALRY